MLMIHIAFHISKPTDEEMKSACEQAFPALEAILSKTLQCLKRRSGGYSVYVNSFSQENHPKWYIHVRKIISQRRLNVRYKTTLKLACIRALLWDPCWMRVVPCLLYTPVNLGNMLHNRDATCKGQR